MSSKFSGLWTDCQGWLCQYNFPHRALGGEELFLYFFCSVDLLSLENMTVSELI